MTTAHDLVFLLDVDNTLLDNDWIVADLRQYLEHEFGPAMKEILRQRLTTVFPRQAHYALDQHRYLSSR